MPLQVVLFVVLFQKMLAFQYFDILGINKEIIKDEGYNIKLFSQHTVMIDDILVNTLKEI